MPFNVHGWGAIGFQGHAYWFCLNLANKTYFQNQTAKIVQYDLNEGYFKCWCFSYSASAGRNLLVNSEYSIIAAYIIIYLMRIRM